MAKYTYKLLFENRGDYGAVIILYKNNLIEESLSVDPRSKKELKFSMSDTDPLSAVLLPTRLADNETITEFWALLPHNLSNHDKKNSIFCSSGSRISIHAVDEHGDTHLIFDSRPQRFD